MLKISEIKIDGAAGVVVTDRRPNISFALESDVAGESLKEAVISVGGWNIKTADQINNLYDGEFNAFAKYEVRIEAVGESGEQATATAGFEAGRLDTPWKAKWITDSTYEFPDKISPVPMTFRKSFNVKKKVRRAFFNISALGIYELELNGHKVGEDYFAPGLTSYTHQIQYQSYDVTSQLESGGNTLLATVAGGWAAGSFNHVRKSKLYADKQAFLCELMIQYTDGTTELICTDESWNVTVEGPYKAADWYDGETFDANVDLANISWKAANITTPRGTPKLLAQYGPPVRAQQIMVPVSQTTAPSGEVIYDFGQNFAGVVSATIQKANKGQTVIFRHAEVLVDGELFVKSLRTAKATATCICKNGEQIYSPRLTYMGFRYVGVRGINPENLDLKALVLHSDIEETGNFSCSNELINRLEQNICWGGKSNFVDIPTDCPQRDEREGWTGDIAVFARTASWHFDMSRFFDKWLFDMRAEQGRGGGLPMTIPRAGNSFPAMASSCWGDACVLVPWAEYMARGDKRLLEKQYPTIKSFLKAALWWANFLSISPNSRYIWRFPYHWGDWCAPGEAIMQWLAKSKWVGTAYFANSCAITAQIADLLDNPEEAEYYRVLREKIVKAYRKILTDGSGNLKKEFQTGYVLPLHFGMTEGTETKIMADNLARLVNEAGNHLSTGFTGTPYLLFALSDNGHTDTAYDLLLQESCPSWLYEVVTGGTTIWERWDALRPDGSVNIGDLTGKKDDEATGGGMVSFNHYANGAVGDWLYRRIAGIEATSGGYRAFRVAPLMGGGITHAKGEVKTPYGIVSSDWLVEGELFKIKVAVPVSTTCVLTLPNGETRELTSGEHRFSCTVSEKTQARGDRP